MTETSRPPRSGMSEPLFVARCTADCRSRLWQRSCSAPCPLSWPYPDLTQASTTPYVSNIARSAGQTVPEGKNSNLEHARESPKGECSSLSYTWNLTIV